VRCDKPYVYRALSEFCTILRVLSAEWHSYKLSEIPNKYRNSLSVLQAQTHTSCPKTWSYGVLLYKYNFIGGNNLEITASPDGVWSDTPLVKPVCKGNRLSTCGGTTYGHHINCAVRAVLHREHSVWYSKQVWLSQLHSTAYKGERTDRELGLTVVLYVCIVNIFMGKADC